eukprot:TRINITY_DN12268_c0_g1_i1.p2 TRINITY_DN12268_c0_g1~~TRINITY_DN12268_c0_g1_i1.p2  ORF type:complete len:151 (+),score=48.74 TRINITY_DN12268_c0_g1_i1:100-552(+)
MGEAEWKANWDLFDRPPRKEKLPKGTVKHLMRAVGRHYTEAALDALLGDGDVSFDAYMEAMRKPCPEPECDMLAAVRAYDGKDSGLFQDAQYVRIIGDGEGAVPDSMLDDAKYMMNFDAKGLPIDEFIKAIEAPIESMQPTLDDILRLGS